MAYTTADISLALTLLEVTGRAGPVVAADWLIARNLTSKLAFCATVPRGHSWVRWSLASTPRWSVPPLWNVVKLVTTRAGEVITWSIWTNGGTGMPNRCTIRAQATLAESPS